MENNKIIFNCDGCGGVSIPAGTLSEYVQKYGINARARKVWDMIGPDGRAFLNDVCGADIFESPADVSGWITDPVTVDVVMMEIEVKAGRA